MKYIVKVLLIFVWSVISTQATTLTSLSLSSSATALNVGETAELTLMGTYSDGSSKEVETGIEYITTPRHSVYISGNTMTVLQDGAITVQAKSNSINSNTIVLDATWIVKGHTLPPEPDKTLNNSTLLGIDTNNNGVRDDVERYILRTYGKEKITIEIGFQVARAYNTVIEHPENAWETDKVLSVAQDCASYFSTFAKYFNEPILLNKNIVVSKKFKSIMLNTRERIRNYLFYNQKLSGGIFTATPIDESKEKCNFDVDNLLKARK